MYLISSAASGVTMDEVFYSNMGATVVRAARFGRYAVIGSALLGFVLLRIGWLLECKKQPSS